VAEVDSGFQQLFDAYFGHRFSLDWVLPASALHGTRCVERLNGSVPGRTPPREEGSVTGRGF
jgi:hypothetical protein